MDSQMQTKDSICLHVDIPPDSVRGRIRVWLEKKAFLLNDSVLDIGSRFTNPSAIWANNRTLRTDLKWIGVDMQPGLNVDHVLDAEKLPWPENTFGGIVCAEMLEHAWRPHIILSEAFRVLKSECWMLITMPFCFPVHNFPSDYWRITPEAMKRLLIEAGFKNIEVSTAGEKSFSLNDHGEPGCLQFTAPIHVFAVAQK